MRLKTYRAMILKILLVASFGLITLSSTYGLERIRWKVSTGGFGLYKESMDRMIHNLMTISEGKIKFRLYKLNELAPVSELFKTVGEGRLDAALMLPIYHTNKIPAIIFFHAVPFGPGFIEFNAWIRYGGGQNLRDRIFADHGFVGLETVMIAAESGGWFRKRYTKIEELKGMKMRFLGLGAKVMRKFGVKTVALSGRDINQGFKKGSIDAAEFSTPDFDLMFGLFKSAKFNYYPSWIQQTNPGYFIINKKKWDRLDETGQAIFRNVCQDTYLWSAIKSNKIQSEAMRELKTKGATFVTWKDSELEKLKKAWLEVAEEESAKDPLFAEVYASYKAFREKYSIWGNRAYLK